MGKIPRRRSPRPNLVFGCRLAEGSSAAASLRRKVYVSEVLQNVMKTLERRDFSFYRQLCKHVHSFPASSPLPPFTRSQLLLPHHPSLRSPPHPPSSCHSISSAFPSCPRSILLLLVQTRVSFGLVCAWRENMGHKQHGKQTTCFLPRSRVVNVDRNRNGNLAGEEGERTVGGRSASCTSRAVFRDADSELGDSELPAAGARRVIDSSISRKGISREMMSLVFFLCHFQSNIRGFVQFLWLRNQRFRSGHVSSEHTDR